MLDVQDTFGIKYGKEEFIMFCRNCGEFMNDNQAICLKCGVATGKGDSFCANCGKPVAANAAVCLSCGVAIKQSEEHPKGYLNGKDKTTILLVCFFLGAFGIHNFMMGETKKGIVRLLTCWCGLGGILALIDFIKLLLDTYKWDPNAAI